MTKTAASGPASGSSHSTLDRGAEPDQVKPDVGNDVKKAVRGCCRCCRKTEKEIITSVGHILSPEGTLADVFRARAQLAVLLREEATPTWPADVHVVVQRVVHYFDSPRQFFLLEYQQPSGAASDGEPSSPCWQIQRLTAIVHAMDVFADTGPTYWPVESTQVHEALYSASLGTLAKSETEKSWQLRLLRWLRIMPPQPTGMLHTLLKGWYGPEVVFSFAWNSFYTQWLWALAAYAVVWTILVAIFGDTMERHAVLRNFSYAGFPILAVVLVIRSWWRFPPHPVQHRVHKKQLSLRPGSVDPLPTACPQAMCSWLMTLLMLMILLMAFFAVVLLVTVALMHLQLYVTYVWGGCAEIDPPCTSAQDTLGFVGWLVDTCVSILTAIIFVLFYAIEGPLSQLVATLLGRMGVKDTKLGQGMVRATLSMLDKMSFTGTLCFVFAPEWYEPPDVSRADRRNLSCDELYFGDAGLDCLRRRLSVSERRDLFEGLLKGPFCVAPFIQILVKVIIPLVARYLQRYVERASQGGEAAGFVPRVLALIFAHDGDSAGGTRFIKEGPPFESTFQNASGEEGKTVVDSLRQVMKKPYEPPSMLANAQESVVWVFCWAPIYPLGILPTLVARILMCHFQLSLLCFVKRQPEPETDHDMRKLQGAAMAQALVLAFGWGLGLAMIAYNDDLWRLGELTKTVVKVLMALWLVVAVFSGVAAVRLEERLRPLPHCPTITAEAGTTFSFANAEEDMYATKEAKAAYSEGMVTEASL